MKLTHRSILVLAVYIFTVVLTTLASADEITFQEGYWAGQPIPDDPTFGCHMAMMLDDETMMAIYTNIEGRFDLMFMSGKWNIPQESDLDAQMSIDGQPITFTRAHLINQKTIGIRAADLDGTQLLENLMRKANRLMIAFHNLDYLGQTAFYDNNLAVTALKNCVKQAKRTASQ